MFIFTALPIFLSGSTENNTATDLELKWEKGEIKDAIEALIFIEKSKHTTGELTSAFKPLIVLGAIALVLVLSYFFVRRYYPIFNFCWGDYLSSFEKIENQRKTIVWVIIIGLVISVAGSIIATALGGLKLF